VTQLSAGLWAIDGISAASQPHRRDTAQRKPVNFNQFAGFGDWRGNCSFLSKYQNPRKEVTPSMKLQTTPVKQ